MKVYLCGPIDGCSDSEAQDWRTQAKDYLGEDQCLDPMRRDYRGKETTHVKEIVEQDLDDIEACDIVLANCWKPGWGTPMEIFYTSGILQKYVIAVVPLGSSISPWLRYYTKAVYVSLPAALVDIKAGVYGQDSYV